MYLKNEDKFLYYYDITILILLAIVIISTIIAVVKLS